MSVCTFMIVFMGFKTPRLYTLIVLDSRQKGKLDFPYMCCIHARYARIWDVKFSTC